LNKAERAVFKEVIAATDPRHFVSTDIPLLATYVQATVMVRSKPRQQAMWECAARVQTMVARALRLTPRSRIGPKRAARNVHQLHPPKPPWEH
jgi:hypothetical protein